MCNNFGYHGNYFARPDSEEGLYSSGRFCTEAYDCGRKVGQMIQYSNNKLLTGPSLDSRNHTEEIKRGEVGSIFNILTVERAKQYQDLAMQSRLRIPLIFGLDVVHGMRTIFPIPMAEAASFNLELIKKRQVWQQRRLLPMEFTGRLLPWLIFLGMPVGGARWKELGKTLGMVARWQRLV